MSVVDEAEMRVRTRAKPRGKHRISGLRLDGRTVAARRCGELMVQFADVLGGADSLSGLKLDECGRCAALVVVAETAMERYLAGGSDVTPDDLIRCTNAANRALRRLGIKAADTKPTERLADYLASKRTGAGQ